MIETIGRPLPVIATYRRSYEILWQNRRILLQLLPLPLVLLIAAVALETRMLGEATTPDQIKVALAAAPHGMIFSWALTMFLGVATLFSFSVSWRRHLLLQEPASSHYFAKPFWRYLGFGVAIYFASLLYFLITFAAVGGVLSAIGLKAQPHLFFALLIIGVILIAGFFLFWLVRHVLLFTAITIDNRELTWKQASGLMRGNVWRFIAIWLLVWLPVTFVADIAAVILASLGVDPETIQGALSLGIIQGTAILLQVTLGASSAALIYDFLVRGGGPGKSTYSIEA